MGEIFSAFGVDIHLITIQLINFGLLMLALWYFLYTPVLKLLSDRQDKVSQGVQDAENAAKKLSEAGVEKDSLLTSAHKEAGEIVEHARVHAKSTESDIIAAAEEKAATVVSNGEKQGQELAAKAGREAEAEIAKTAILAAEKILKEK